MKKLLVLPFAIFLLGIGESRAQAVTDLLNFNGTNGDYPSGGLTLSGDNLYGMVGYGGANNVGSIFIIKTNGTGYRDLHDFTGAAGGAGPLGDLLMSGNKFYGMTTSGGGAYEGTIFSMDTDGSEFTVLLSFASRTTGYGPAGALIISGTQLFGMADGGGTSNEGTVFSVDTNGNNFKVLLDFNDTNGAYPYGSLTRIGNVLYGMTPYNIFSIDSDGNGFRNLYTFTCSTGCTPRGNLLLLGHKFFGVTWRGGVLNYGTVFSIDTNGSGYLELHDFSSISVGALPAYGGLSYSNGLLYGMATSGGAGGYGVAFSIDTDGSGYGDVALFNKTDGAYPQSVSVTLDGNRMFGMAQQGGLYDSGVVFGYSFCSIGINVNLLTPVSCHGDSNGSAVAAATSGNAPYTYFWSTIPAQFTTTATGLKIGTYTVTIFDNNGCADTASIVITQPLAMGDSMSFGCATCCNCKGYTRDSVFGGSQPYTFLWSNGRTNDTLHSLVAGTYTCTVTDARGCTKIDSVVVTQGDHLTPGSSNITCFGDNNGTATAETSGNYDYTWSPGGQTTATATGLSAGVYMVTVTNPDTVGCFATYTFTITEPPPLQISLSSNNGCNGSGGSAVLTVSGGTPGYLYTWAPAGGSGSSANGLSTGVYTVTVTDANSCTNSAVFSIFEPPVLGASVSVCCGYSGGSCADTSCNYRLGVSAYGGTPPYNINVTGGTNPCYSQLLSIMVTDANGCVYTSGADIDIGLSIRIQVNNNVTCYGGTNGVATVNQLTGTTGSIYYSWSPGGGTNQTESNLSAGTYTVTVSQVFPTTCSVQEIFVITQPPALTITADSVDATTGNCDGSASAIANGGTSPYTYNWATAGQTTATITGQCAGDYCCNVTDANGCNESVCVTVATTTGTEQLIGKSEELRVYPDPNNGKFIVTFSHPELVSGTQPILRIYNTLGQQIYVATPQTLRDGNSIDISSQPDGIYLLRIENEDGTLITEQKIVKM